MKKRTKIIVILILCLIAVCLISALFIVPYIEQNQEYDNTFAENIIDPDRIVYKDEEGKYYQFEKGTEQYNELKYTIAKSVTNYNESGNTLTDEDIDKIHEKSFIEFDYETASKNYIIPLEENEEKSMIKLGTTGGMVVTTKLKNFNNIKKIANKISEGQPIYELRYQEMISRNTITTMEYKYLQQFKEINYKIHQVKVENIEDYEKYKEMCNLAFDEEITAETFVDNDLILTISLVPKITVKVSIGNIKYTYEQMNDVAYQYTAHLLIVSKIVNTDCIYNTDLTEVDSKVALDEFKTKYDEAVENIDRETFVTNFNEFYNQYQASTNTITQEKAEEIAEKGFKEAERVVGSYDKSTQMCEEMEANPNNFFTRKTDERDETAQYKVDVYSFLREDDMGNGVRIYVDKRLGKIIGASAFGD